MQKRFVGRMGLLLILVLGVAAAGAAARAEDAARCAPPLCFNPGPEYADGVRMFQGISGIERAANGRLWATWYGGGTGEDRHNYIMLVTSGDNGKTWSDVQQANIRHTVSRLFIRRLRSGKLLLVKHNAIDKAGGRSLLNAFLSEDDGKAWKGGLMIDERNGVSYCQPADGSPNDWVLSPHGEAMKEWYDFAERHPDRGASYAPVALLLPFNQGMPQWSGNPWSYFPPERADTMIDAFLYTITPFSQDLRKGQEGCLANGPFGDIYDVLVPDPPGGPIALDKLRDYKVAILLGKFELNAPLAARLTEYVRESGTLAINSQQVGDSLPREFLGVKRTGKTAAIESPVFSSRGDFEYGLNKVFDGWWVYLINNKGVTKYTTTPEKLDVAQTARVIVELRALPAASLRELRKDEPVRLDRDKNAFTIQVGPGEIRIVKITTHRGGARWTGVL